MSSNSSSSSSHAKGTRLVDELWMPVSARQRVRRDQAMAKQEHETTLKDKWSKELYKELVKVNAPVLARDSVLHWTGTFACCHSRENQIEHLEEVLEGVERLASLERQHLGCRCIESPWHALRVFIHPRFAWGGRPHRRFISVRERG